MEGKATATAAVRKGGGIGVTNDTAEQTATVKSRSIMQNIQ